MAGGRQAAQLEVPPALSAGRRCAPFMAEVDEWVARTRTAAMIRKLASGEYRIYSRKPDPKTGKRRNLGTFPTREKAEKHEREIQYFKHH